MYIVDYTTDWGHKHVETKTFTDKAEIIAFIADKSNMKDFRLNCINEYKRGKLYPYHVELSHGRIVIEETPQEAEK